MGTDQSFTVDECLFVGRTYEEYCAMFDLDEDSLGDRTVLDCPSGAGSFVSEAIDRGVSATGVDAMYDKPPSELESRVRADVASVASQLPEKRSLFDWDYYGTVERRLELLETATEAFLADYSDGRTSGRYVYGELPQLPFGENSFSLVLSAHLLFLYGDRLDVEFHVAALRELCRVASDELRVFPLVGLDTEPYEHLDDVIETLRGDGYAVECRSVSFEFQRGATELLAITV